MSITAQCFAEDIFASSTTTIIFTAGNNQTAIIDKFTACNTDGSSARTLTVYLVPASGTPGASNTVISVFSIASNVTKDFTELQNQILNPGDSIQVVASVAALVAVRASGRVIQ